MACGGSYCVLVGRPKDALRVLKARNVSSGAVANKKGLPKRAAFESYKILFWQVQPIASYLTTSSQIDLCEVLLV
jgi:hypothetical protein